MLCNDKEILGVMLMLSCCASRTQRCWGVGGQYPLLSLPGDASTAQDFLALLPYDDGKFLNEGSDRQLQLVCFQ